MKNVLVIDNIDSFVYNLVQYAGILGGNPIVVQNTVKMEEIEEIIKENSISHIIISPGPKTPKEAGISNQIIKKFGPNYLFRNSENSEIKTRIPILGICLGHQCIGYVFGAKIRKAKTLRHGKTSLIKHCGKGILKGIKSPLAGARYHSLVVARKNLPDCLEIIAESSDDGEIMGLKHRDCEIYGLQFHPESILTKEGIKIVKNFLEITSFYFVPK